MARIDALPSLEIIRGLKGILDFYVWKGLPCVRAWPQYRPARQTEPSRNAALLFGAIIKAFSLTAGPVLDQLALEATGIPRTPRDIYVSGVYGNLHEASMSDFLDLLTECRDFLSNLQALLNALDSLSLDELDVNVEASVLPTDASTLAEQQSQTAYLQDIQKLYNALQSIAADRLIVRGEDQLFTINGPVAQSVTAAISGADGYIQSAPVPAGFYWDITTIVARDVTTATTAIDILNLHDAVFASVRREARAFAANEDLVWSGHTFLDVADVIRVYFTGGLADDVCRLDMTGYQMTVET